MRIAYFDCFAGISGEMLLAALIGAGLSFGALQRELSGLRIGGYALDVQSVVRKELSGTYLNVIEKATADSGQPRRNGKGTEKSDAQNGFQLLSAAQVIGKSALPDLITQTSLAIFRKLAQAEGAILPENGNVDIESRRVADIVTVVGVVAGLSLLGIGRVECSPIHVGSGVTYSAEGIRPALSPVAAEILRTSSVPVYGSHVAGELVTPLGAAIITTIASAFGAVPAMKIGAVGYGAGKYDLMEAPNLVRLFIGETSNDTESLHATAGLPRPEGRASHTLPVPVTAQPPRTNELEPAAQTSSNAKPFIATHEEWASLTVQGHQQSGRQRLAS
jgi:pyridinium-3,5-bisthiocarboxylic acid mononucleotide nickel chelatase